MSPNCRPAASALSPGTTSCTSTPSPGSSFKAGRNSSGTAATRTPSCPRRGNASCAAATPATATSAAQAAPCDAARHGAGRRGALAAVAPVPARQTLLPEPVVAERLVAAPTTVALGEPAAHSASRRRGSSTRRRTGGPRRLGGPRRCRYRPPRASRDPVPRRSGRSSTLRASLVSLYSVACPSASLRLALARCSRCSAPGRRPRRRAVPAATRGRTGDAAPGGGAFDRFGAEAMPIVAPVNARGDIAFFATLSRAGVDEGFFLSSRGRVTAVASEGDRVAGRGPPVRLRQASGARRSATTARSCSPRPSRGGARSRASSPRRTAVSGRWRSAAPPSPAFPRASWPRSTRPTINAKGDVAFLATVRRGRENLEAILLSTRGQLKKIVAQGDPAPAGGAFAAFGPP